MKIIILNKREFDQMMEYTHTTDENVEEKDIMLISVCSPPEDDGQPFISQLSQESWFKGEHSNVKIMYFGDYGDSDENEPYVFTADHAKELFEFIKNNENKSLAIIHCGAGISRSGAIGTFIYDLYGSTSYDEFRRKNPRINPNPRVLRLLYEEVNKDKYKKITNES